MEPYKKMNKMKGLKTQSTVIGLSDESVERILSENGFENVGLVINSIQKHFSGAGHYKLSVQIFKNGAYNDLWLDKVTTNMRLIDDWGEDEMYFGREGTGHWYNNHNEVMEAALEEVVRCEYNQELLKDLVDFP